MATRAFKGMEKSLMHGAMGLLEAAVDDKANTDAWQVQT